MSHPNTRNHLFPFDLENALKSPPVTSPGIKSPGFKSPGIKSPGLLKSPRQGLFLRPNGSSTSINDMPHTPNGLRAQLGHLLPKHAYFRARVVIHQLSSVPYVGGEFGVRWKFKGVQLQHPGPGSKHGLLDRVKARSENKRSNSNDHHVGKVDKVTESSAQADEPNFSIVSPGGTQSNNTGDSLLTHPDPIRSNTLSSFTSSISSQTSGGSGSTEMTTELGAFSMAFGTNTSTSTTIATPVTKPNSGSTTPDAIPMNSAPARGMTPFIPLKDHTVLWSQTLDTTLKFDIDRENSNVLPNPLKLVVMQRVIPGDPNGNPQNPRLGAVYLNLAEYVGQGSVERRYLLKESKTNATLKVSVL